nr:TAXI family TRAP transporter solute-binding subunit [bacterium]
MKKRIASLAVVLVLVATALSGCSLTKLRPAAGAKKGIYTDVMNSLMDVWKQKGGFRFADLATSNGSSNNLQQQDNGNVDISIIGADYLSWSRAGTGAMLGTRLSSSVVLFSLYANYVQLVVPKDSDIKGLADLKGKRIATDVKETPAFFHARDLLQMVGLDWNSTGEGKDFLELQRISMYDAIDEMSDGNIDAFICVAAAGNPYLDEALGDDETPFKIISIEDSILEQAAATSPYYVIENLPEGAYQNFNEPVKTLAIRTCIVVRRSMKDKTVTKLMNTLFDNLDALEGERTDEITLESAITGIELRYLHPAALQFFIDKGLIEEGQVELK